MKNLQHGFTLVEIAIVLVIIGLLLGGILKGQEMITQAKTKNVIADFSGISTAYHSYQDRYRATPGDDSGAAARWAVAPAAVSGNGNGTIAGAYNADCAAASPPESCQWWDHLRRAGFIAGNGAIQPLNAAGGMIGVQTGDTAGGAALGGLSGLILCSANLPDKIALAVDTQIDNGLSVSGSVRAALNSASNPAIDNTTSAAGSYAETGSNVYTLCRQL
ncbi:MAG TPA: prepilin-type N-terminal cleavage/methylation domain-containing protein [Burkholderiales bacterium]|nr:prepilin-type N-terminal cleavage/methylation domain-containing protein [Burkholderiales bacterium]